MSSDRLPRHLLIGFAATLIGYAAFFSIDQSIRSRKGPWEVLFTTNSAGAPSIVVSQPRLGIQNVRVSFANELLLTNSAGQVLFNKPQQQIPFGKTKFEDFTYLPGSVAFDFFGHEVELLPRTLYLNKKEQGWTNNTEYTLQPGEKLPPEAFVDPRKKKRRR